MNFGAIQICLLFTPPFPHLPLAVALPGLCRNWSQPKSNAIFSQNCVIRLIFKSTQSSDFVRRFWCASTFNGWNYLKADPE